MQLLIDRGFRRAGDLAPSGALWVRYDDAVAVVLGTDRFEVQANVGPEAVRLIGVQPTEPKIARYLDLVLCDAVALEDQQEGESLKGWRHRAA
jgi:hypothetical protein